MPKDKKNTVHKFSSKVSFFERKKEDISRFKNIINLTAFKTSKDIDLTEQNLLFDPIHENFVFLLKYTNFLCEKLERFFNKKKNLDVYKKKEKENLIYSIQLTPLERAKVKMVLYRVLFYILQIKNYIKQIIVREIITPKFFLFYSRDHPGEYLNLSDMVKKMNLIEFERYINENKQRLKYIETFFKRNTIQILSLRRFKYVFRNNYLNKVILLAISLTSNSKYVRAVICDFFFFYNFILEYFYIFNPNYMSLEYFYYKQQEKGYNGSLRSTRFENHSNTFQNIVSENFPKIEPIEKNKLKKKVFSALKKLDSNKFKNFLVDNKEIDSDVKDLSKDESKEESSDKGELVIEEKNDELKNAAQGEDINTPVVNENVSEENIEHENEDNAQELFAQVEEEKLKLIKEELEDMKNLEQRQIEDKEPVSDKLKSGIETLQDEINKIEGIPTEYPVESEEYIDESNKRLKKYL